jgi:hypothetical protein
MERWIGLDAKILRPYKLFIKDFGKYLKANNWEQMKSGQII